MIVAKAVGNNDYTKLQTVTVDEASSSDLEDFIQRTRPKTWPKKMTTFQAKAFVLNQKKKTGKGLVRIDVDSAFNPLPPPLPPLPPAPEEPETATEASVVEGAETPVAAIGTGSPEEEPVQEAEPPPPPPPPPRPETLHSVLAWRLNQRRGWLFDPLETLKPSDH